MLENDVAATIGRSLLSFAVCAWPAARGRTFTRGDPNGARVDPCRVSAPAPGPGLRRPAACAAEPRRRADNVRRDARPPRHVHLSLFFGVLSALIATGWALVRGGTDRWSLLRARCCWRPRKPAMPSFI